MITKITIDNKTITLLHSRKLINNNNTPQEFIQRTITMSEYKISSVSALSIEINPDTLTPYYPKRIFTDLVPFLTEIIKNDVVIKSAYCFGLRQHEHNKYDEQIINKDIEVVVDLETPETTIKQLILNCVNNMHDRCFYIDENTHISVLTLTAVKVELLKEIREQRINSIQSYKDDKCIICLNTNPTILFCDCGHTCICEECYILLDENKCPKCRTNNKTIRKI